MGYATTVTVDAGMGTLVPSASAITASLVVGTVVETAAAGAAIVSPPTKKLKILH